MNKQVICDYINYNAPKLHNLGDKLRAMIDARYRLYHIGEDIIPSQIVNITSNEDCLKVAVNRHIKGSPVYIIPDPLISLAFPIFLETICNTRTYQEYILNLTSDAFFWDNFAIFHSDIYWMLAIIPDPFELPRWFFMDKYDEIISIKYSNDMPCPIMKTEDVEYSIIETPIDNEYIQDLIS